MKIKMQTVRSGFLIMLFISIISQSLLAQGDGPRSFLLAPKGLWGLNPKYLNLDQNILPAGNILVKDAQIKVDVFPTTFFHTFSIGGRYAQLLFMVNPGSASGTVEADRPGVPAPKVSASGFSDGFVGMKIGLIGAPALNVMEFAKHIPAFSMTGYFRWWYSGTYDAKKPLNLGTNRSSFEIGFPMAIPFSKNPKRATWLEVYPSVQLYTTNTNPTLVTRANETHQQPLFLLENHLTHNFTDKFWAGVNLRYQYGGVLELDGVKQDNQINILGGGVVAGYQFLPFLGASADYGGIFTGDNGAESKMFRISLVFVYVNTKKLKQQASPVPAPVIVVDTDGDGIPDNVDKCPTVAGVAKYNGCPIPDTDGDGINDENDKCPTVAGVAKYQGCPIPDTDGDGINDENDKCPTVAGIAKYQGCPIPDTDGDGINDEEDKCPKTFGIASNLGCPEMTYYYKRADANLSAADKLSLDSVVTFMNNNPTLNVLVQGYTSAPGTEAYNQKLSEKRVNNSIKYMVSKGIEASRLQGAGYGEKDTIGDQKTEAGRAASRRVVMKIAQ